MQRPCFHLAFPVDDLARARVFYGDLLGLSEGRSSDHWVDWDFYGHQVVTHLSDVTPGGPVAYSRVDGQQVPVPHFGLVLRVDQFHQVARTLKDGGVEFVIE